MGATLVAETSSTEHLMKNKTQKKKRHTEHDRESGDQSQTAAALSTEVEGDLNGHRARQRKRPRKEPKTPLSDPVIADRVPAIDSTATASKEAKIKKKKEPRSDHSESTKESLPVDGGSVSTKPSKRKRRDASTIDAYDEADATIPKTEDNVEKLLKSPKKAEEKRKRNNQHPNEVESTERQSTDEPPKKKRKSKKKLDFPNPSGDATLSEQATKALSYAYAQICNPPSWKFNKAKQNWLSRNYWSDMAIPDPHLPLAIKYLSGAQGAARENLLAACQKVTDSQNEKPETNQTSTEAAVNDTDSKTSRAHMLREALIG